MSRKKKDPLRELTEPERQELEQLSRSQAAPAAEVTRAKILLAVAARRRLPGRGPLRRPPLRRRRLPPRRPLQRRGPRRPDAPPRRRPTADLRPAGAGADRRRGRPGRRPPRPTAPRPGRSRPCSGRSAPPPTACRRSRPIPSGSPSASPGPATSAPAPGAPPARPCAAARPGRWSSPTRTPSRKKVDRGGLPHGRGDGPGGLVHRPGRALPDDPLRRASRGGPRATRRGSRTSTSATARPRP